VNSTSGSVVLFFGIGSLLLGRGSERCAVHHCYGGPGRCALLARVVPLFVQSALYSIKRERVIWRRLVAARGQLMVSIVFVQFNLGFNMSCASVYGRIG